MLLYQSANNMVLMSSLLILPLMALLMLSTTSCAMAESVNKDKTTVSSPIASSASAAAAADVPLVKGAAAVIMDHSDLPTRFGDEDDVIEGKVAAAAEKKASADHGTNGNGSNGKTDAKKHDGKNGNGGGAFDRDSNEDHYDDDEDYLIKEHVDGKHEHDMDESESEYEDETDLGPTLDNFGTKLDGSDTGEELPIFLVEPQSAYVIRNRAAVLKCKAAHALQVNNCLFVFFSSSACIFTFPKESGLVRAYS